MSDSYVSPYLMQPSRMTRPSQEFPTSPEEVMADDGLSLAEKSLYLDRMEQDTIAAITMEDRSDASAQSSRLLEAIKMARRGLAKAS